MQEGAETMALLIGQWALESECQLQDMQASANAVHINNSPSSRDLQYLTRKNMWKTKSRPAGAHTQSGMACMQSAALNCQVYVGLSLPGGEGTGAAVAMRPGTVCLQGCFKQANGLQVPVPGPYPNCQSQGLTQIAKEKEVGEQPPYLALFEY